jgi:hypothetical protein
MVLIVLDRQRNRRVHEGGRLHAWSTRAIVRVRQCMATVPAVPRLSGVECVGVAGWQPYGLSLRICNDFLVLNQIALLSFFNTSMAYTGGAHACMVISPLSQFPLHI